MWARDGRVLPEMQSWHCTHQPHTSEEKHNNCIRAWGHRSFRNLSGTFLPQLPTHSSKTKFLMTVKFLKTNILKYVCLRFLTLKNYLRYNIFYAILYFLLYSIKIISNNALANFPLHRPTFPCLSKHCYCFNTSPMLSIC